jgi:radical SAM protein with 4Fe4S-binding SPASM domain
MEHVSYSSFSAAVHRKGVRAHVPMNVTFELTRRCPLACQHCYNNLPVADRAARAAELSLADHRRLLDELAEMGALWLLYTGGEILARPDFLDIYTHAKARGFIITLFTNGTLVTPGIADRLAAMPPFAIEITLYGHTRQTYEAVTGLPGSFDRCLRGIRALRDRKLPLKLKTVALTLNKHELDDMARFAADLGVAFTFDAMMSPRLDCSQSPLDVRLAPEESVELDLRDPARMAAWAGFVDQYMRGPRAPVPADQVYSCGGGIGSFAVDPYGGMSICVLSEKEKYDLARGTVADGWNHFLREVRSRKITRRTKCTTCQIKPLCGMCPANGELENGDPEQPVDFLCQVAHLRATALGLTVAPHGSCEYCAGGTRRDELDLAFARLEKAASLPLQPARRQQTRPAALAVWGSPKTQPDISSGSCATGSCSSCVGS